MSQYSFLFCLFLHLPHAVLGDVGGGDGGDAFDDDDDTLVLLHGATVVAAHAFEGAVDDLDEVAFLEFFGVVAFQEDGVALLAYADEVGHGLVGDDDGGLLAGIHAPGEGHAFVGEHCLFALEGVVVSADEEDIVHNGHLVVAALAVADDDAVGEGDEAFDAFCLEIRLELELAHEAGADVKPFQVLRLAGFR